MRKIFKLLILSLIISLVFSKKEENVDEEGFIMKIISSPFKLMGCLISNGFSLIYIFVNTSSTIVLSPFKFLFGLYEAEGISGKTDYVIHEASKVIDINNLLSYVLPFILTIIVIIVITHLKK